VKYPELKELRDDVRGLDIRVSVNASPHGGVVVNLRSPSARWHVRVWARNEEDAAAAARAAWSELR
jgi:hypothetical protein